MFIGIDLGTSNSSLAVFDGDSVVVVPNSLGENLTPSVVRMDARGAIVTGRKAYGFLESDPANTWGEFKRLMGTGDRLPFAAAQQELLPEELSAKVIASLLADARDGLGFLPRAAVISTPALIELPQNHATMRAAKLAGLSEVALMQEPIASAIAAGWRSEPEGMWLVFDLGGGTLDVSLLKTQEGRLRVRRFRSTSSACCAPRPPRSPPPRGYSRPASGPRRTRGHRPPAKARDRRRPRAPPHRSGPPRRP